jgi:hypothetical protein
MQYENLTIEFQFHWNRMTLLDSKFSSTFTRKIDDIQNLRIFHISKNSLKVASGIVHVNLDVMYV